MMTSVWMQTRDVAHRLLAAVGSGDHATIAALYADRVDVAVNWPASEIGGRVPWIRHRATGADMVQHFAEIAAHNRPHGEGTTVETILVDGSDAVVFGTIRLRLVDGGRPYVARFALRLTVTDGRITRHHVYEDSLSVFRAFDTDSPE